MDNLALTGFFYMKTNGKNANISRADDFMKIRIKTVSNSVSAVLHE